MKGAKQTTLRDQIAVSGIGVHSGLPVTLTLNPAGDDEGIIFRRVSAEGSVEREVRADVRSQIPCGPIRNLVRSHCCLQLETPEGSGATPQGPKVPFAPAT